MHDLFTLQNEKNTLKFLVHDSQNSIYIFLPRKFSEFLFKSLAVS